MNLIDEFQSFTSETKLKTAIILLKRAEPFLHTWYEQSHSGTGSGALNLLLEIRKFLKDLE